MATATFYAVHGLFGVLMSRLQFAVAPSFSQALRHLLNLLALGIVASPCWGADWPQWQGALRNAVSPETGLLQQWPEDGPPLAWKVDKLGGGDSAPAIVAGCIYGMSIRDGKEIVW